MGRTAKLSLALLLGGLALAGCAQSADAKYTIGPDVCRNLPYSALPAVYGTPGELPNGGAADSGDEGDSSCTRSTSGGAIIRTSFDVFDTAAEAFADYDGQLPPEATLSPSLAATASPSVTTSASVTASPSARPAMPSPSPSLSVGPSTAMSPSASSSASPTASPSSAVVEVPSSLSSRVDAVRMMAYQNEIYLMLVDGNLVMTVTVSADSTVAQVPGTPADVATFAAAVLDAMAPTA